jgi:hypothetical protein
MKYDRTNAFKGDYRDLNESERAMFRAVVRDQFHPAAERKAQEPGSPWPKSLRIRDVEGAPGVWEMTWSFSGPDGRATFEWTKIDGEPAIRWRRIGNHSIYRDP